MRIFWTLRLSTALVWAAAAASATWWGLQLSRPSSGPVFASVDSQAPLPMPDPSALSSFLGAPPAVDANSLATANAGRVRFTLIGVAAEGADGAALISTDGQPSRPYRVGWALDDNTVLQSVGQRHAVLASKADRQRVQRIEMPAPPPVGLPAAR